MPPVTIIEVIIVWEWPNGRKDMKEFKCSKMSDIQAEIDDIKIRAKEGTVVVSTQKVTYR